MREQSAVYKVPNSVMHSNFQHSTGRSLRITNPVTLPDAPSVKKSSRTSPSAGSCKGSQRNCKERMFTGVQSLKLNKKITMQSERGTAESLDRELFSQFHPEKFSESYFHHEKPLPRNFHHETFTTKLSL